MSSVLNWDKKAPKTDWRAKLVEPKKGFPQVEIRKEGLLIIVNDGRGYNHKWYTSNPDQWGRSTKGIHFHIASNGPLQWTFEEYMKFTDAIVEARDALAIYKKHQLKVVD